MNSSMTMNGSTIDNYVLNEEGVPVKNGQFKLNKNPFVDFNIIHTVGGSLLNRDDSNRQKTVTIGGVPRMRISSQCWKRVIRKYMEEETVNTRRLTFLLRHELAHLNLTDKDFAKIDKFVVKKYLVDDMDEEKNSKKTKRAHYVSMREVAGIADFVEEHISEILAGEDISKAMAAKKIATVLTEGISVNKALFGCMATEAYIRSVNGAAQVLQSFSVDAYTNGSDYFVAQEDVKTGLDVVDWGNDTEAAIPGSMDLNSNTLYRHVTLNIGLLIQNLSVGKNLTDPAMCDAIKDAVKQTIEKFATALVLLTPSAKQNSCETRTTPYAVFVNTIYTKDTEGMKTYETAFVKPVVYNGVESIEKTAADCLAKEVAADAKTGLDPRKYIGRYWVEKGMDRSFPENFGITTDLTYKAVIEQVKAMVDEIEFVRVE